MYGMGFMNYQPYPQNPAVRPPMRQFGMKQEVIRVNGKNGAEAYQMMPNSSVLLLDETAPLVWLVTTDGAGYKTMNPYRITPYQQEQAIDTRSLEERIKRLEDIINEKSDDAAITSKHDTAIQSVTAPGGIVRCGEISQRNDLQRGRDAFLRERLRMRMLNRP